MEPLDSNLPYHTRFFDVITIPPTPTEEELSSKESFFSFLNSFNSIMCYEDAILDAIRELKDGHNGSNIHAIKKHIQAHLFYENVPNLSEQEAECLSLEMPQWKEHLFIQALKSLVEKNCITHSPCIKNGSTLYKLSHEYKKHCAEELKLRMERLNQYKVQHQEKRKQILMMEKRKKAMTPVHKPILKKGHLVETQTVAIVGTERKGSMDMDREKQKEKRSALPHTSLGLHADDYDSLPGMKKKGLRDQLKIPHGKLYVKEIIESPKRDDESLL